MITKCPKCEAVLNVAGGYDRQKSQCTKTSAVEGGVEIRIVCHECDTEFTPKYSGTINN